jgi:hypothetical protein
MFNLSGKSATRDDLSGRGIKMQDICGEKII